MYCNQSGAPRQNQRACATALTLLSTVVCAIWAPSVLAQQPTATQTTGEVVVTASRIQNLNFTAPTPTTTVGAQEFQSRAATKISDVLFELPAARPAPVASNVALTGGGNFANLRGLGNTRTLVLVDGRRFVPTTVTGQVDLSVVPSALIDRADVVTGGASAAWGSDAVAGVTNFIFKKRLDGFQGNLQYGMSGHADNKTVQGSLAWGTSFAGGRGQVMVAGEYSKVSDVPKLGDRDWSNKQTVLVQPGQTPSPALSFNGVNYTRAVLSGVTMANATNGSVVTGVYVSASPVATAVYGVATQAPAAGAAGQFAGTYFQPGGAAVINDLSYYGTNYSGPFMVGGKGGWIGNDVPLTLPLERKNLYVRSTFDVTDNITVFGEASHAETYIDNVPFQTFSPNADNAIYVNISNPFIPQNLRTLMQANNVTGLQLGRINTEVGPAHFITKNSVDRVAGGLDGTLGENWKWNAYYTHGETKYNFEIRNFINEANYRHALNGCAAQTLVLNPGPSCIAANPFGQGSFSPQVVAYITGTEAYELKYKQDAGGAAISGEAFKGWAGPVSVAAGVESRRESIGIKSDANSQNFSTNPAVISLLQGSTSIAGGGWQFSNPKPFGGSYTVNEMFGETEVPLLVDLPFVKALNLNAAVRNTDYSTSGRVTTWKAGLTYTPITGLLLRGTQSKDIRAANLNELFVAGQVNAGGATNDPRPAGVFPGVGGSVQGVITISQGNTNLQPEKADTTTLGATWTPPQVKGLTAAVDFYRINLKNAIAQPGGANILNSCFGASGTVLTPSNCQYLNFVNGNATSGALVSIINPWQNIASILSKGVDVELGYRFPLANLSAGLPGTLNLRALGSRALQLKTNSGFLITQGVGDTGGVPKWVWNLSGTYQTGPWSLFVQARYLDKVKINNNFSGTVGTTATDIVSNDVPSYTYVNTSLQYTVLKNDKTSLTVYGNINNLLDKDPPLTGGTATVGPAPQSYYDLVGRAFTLGMRFTY